MTSKLQLFIFKCLFQKTCLLTLQAVLLLSLGYCAFPSISVLFGVINIHVQSLTQPAYQLSVHLTAPLLNVPRIGKLSEKMPVGQGTPGALNSVKANVSPLSLFLHPGIQVSYILLVIPVCTIKIGALVSDCNDMKETLSISLLFLICLKIFGLMKELS